MQKHEVKVEITKTYTTKVVVEGDFVDEFDFYKAAETKAETMNHDHWDYNDTEFEVMTVNKIPEHFSPVHVALLECGRDIDSVKNYSAEDAEAELQAMTDSL